MSKKRKNKLIKGKFYICYVVGRHPALIYRKNIKRNKYDAVIFGTTYGRHRIILSKPIAENIKCSVVHMRPIRGTRNDFGDRELFGFYINKIDKITIEKIKKKKLLETNSYKNKNRTEPLRVLRRGKNI